MVDETGFANYAFVVQVQSCDHDLVNNFGYRREEKFQEHITRKIMQALAQHPYLVAVSVNSIDAMDIEFVTEDMKDAEGDD